MYDWLETGQGAGTYVVTASRRLARDLRREHATRMLATGATAWRTPAISYWQDWLVDLLQEHGDARQLPTLINAQQSRVLWERCLRRETSDPLLNIPMLARQARDCYLRIQEWNVPLARVQAQARNYDQRLFAKAMHDYRSILEREGWADESQAAELVIALAAAGRLGVIRKISVAGFDRLTPRTLAVLEALEKQGGTVLHVRATAAASAEPLVYRAEHAAAEFRAAGAWAREELQRDPEARIGIVVTQLEQQASAGLRLVKEGLMPGWQLASQAQNGLVNISYGQKLSQYPAVSVALLVLAWLHRDLPPGDISRVLTSPLCGVDDLHQRSRLEMRLRSFPEQSWSPAALLAFLGGQDGDGIAGDGLDLLRVLAASRTDLPRRATPAEWVALFSTTLQSLAWPGVEPLASAEFQLVNRWRELLNEFARLELVAPDMTAAEARGRLATLANEAIFQPEAGPAAVQILGPLEAAGLEFDKLWVTGASGGNWPPAGRPLSLVSRDLQREYGMPDATPSDTLDYATRVIDRLATSAERVVFSFPQSLGDAEQSMSDLLTRFSPRYVDAPADPGWYAATLQDEVAMRPVRDRVPRCMPGERITGGAAIIQQQLTEPFQAFVKGRLHLRSLLPLASGLHPVTRGQLIHAALQRLYSGCPSGDEIRGWDTEQRARRIDAAVGAAFHGYLQHAGDILRQLLQLEQQRACRLLEAVVDADCERGRFRIVAVEKACELAIEGLVFRLRIDRVDRDSNDELFVIDYKTGAGKKIVDRDQELRDMQLVVYTLAFDEPIGGIGLFNVDSRDVQLIPAGRDISEKLDWADALPRWQAQVVAAVREITGGDVRLNAVQPITDARPLALLSRSGEFLHGD